MKNKTLFIAATHGDEGLGVAACQNLKQTRNDFDWMIGNEPAYKKQVRYIDTDLNRSAPGNINSTSFEERRAADIIQKTKNYSYTIDIHGAKNKMGICLIVTKITKENLRLASYIDVETILIWPSITPEMQYPLSEYFPCGLEIECGDKYNPNTTKQLTKILSTFLNTLEKKEQWTEDQCIAMLKTKKIYTMYGTIETPKNTEKKKFRELKEITYNNERFTPVFIQTYKDYTNIFCYKLQKTTINEITKLMDTQ
ncbi:succinylglutamate desuccinylase/aspartoacylase family protein [Patescibacteria group bacterium]|nr:succinylglutamate desuccinylase/aspartoacylase family protein [Patescibacteria group bacterium]MBU1721352.1 succinylglutamate desuccinylase/aspartoacylase family protein [Patescibacteria group bacterium]MBU1901560.1 succinylglutamate desuccinylase/aspartoacylase family protein [Patescibacteria group bacterium]